MLWFTLHGEKFFVPRRAQGHRRYVSSCCRFGGTRAPDPHRMWRHSGFPATCSVPVVSRGKSLSHCKDFLWHSTQLGWQGTEWYFGDRILVYSFREWTGEIRFSWVSVEGHSHQRRIGKNTEFIQNRQLYWRHLVWSVLRHARNACRAFPVHDLAWIVLVRLRRRNFQSSVLRSGHSLATCSVYTPHLKFSFSIVIFELCGTFGLVQTVRFCGSSNFTG